MNKIDKKYAKEIIDIFNKLKNINIYINEYGFDENYDFSIKEKIKNFDNLLNTIEKKIGDGEEFN